MGVKMHHRHGFHRGFGFARFSCWHEPHFGAWFGHYPFPRREEYLNKLKRYRDWLKEELEEIEKEISDLER